MNQRGIYAHFRRVVALSILMIGAVSCTSDTLTLVCDGVHTFTDLSGGEEIKENRTETYVFKGGKLNGIIPVEWSDESIYYRADSDRSTCRHLCYRTISIDRASSYVSETTMQYPPNGRVYESKFVGKCHVGKKQF